MSRLAIIVGIFTLACSLIAPVFVFAATSSVQVGQPSNTGVIPPSAGGGSGGSGSGASDTTSPQISNVVVSVSYDSATINWITNELALSRVAWGTTPDYRDGNISGEQFTKKHSTLMSGLLPHSQYYFSLTTIDTNNNESSYMGEFLTLVRPDTQPPINTSQFTAVPRTDHIQLYWNNPTDPDFDLTRVVRSDKFFPLDPFNGQVVYEGRGNSFADTTVNPGTVYYYAGFSRDRTGNYSSGSVAYTMIAWFSELGLNNDPGAPVVDLQLPSVAFPPTDPKSFQDFIITYKNGLVVDQDNPVIPVGENLKIVIPKSKLPDTGSFLTLTVKDLTNKTTESTYLFAYDQPAKEYFVTTPAFKIEQVYGLVVTVFTSSKLIIEKVNGIVKIVNVAKASDEGVAGQESNSQGLPDYVIVISVLGAGLIASGYFWRIVRIRSQSSGDSGTKSRSKKLVKVPLKLPPRVDKT